MKGIKNIYWFFFCTIFFFLEVFNYLLCMVSFFQMFKHPRKNDQRIMTNYLDISYIYIFILIEIKSKMLMTKMIMALKSTPMSLILVHNHLKLKKKIKNSF